MRFGRIVLYALGGGIALIVAAIAAVMIRPEILAGAPPKIAAGIAFDPDRETDSAHAFDARLRSRFPPGTPEDALRAELELEGFVHDEHDLRSWNYTWGFPCGNWLSATWTADRQGRIARVEGSYSYRCV